MKIKHAYNTLIKHIDTTQKIQHKIYNKVNTTQKYNTGKTKSLNRSKILPKS